MEKQETTAEKTSTEEKQPESNEWTAPTKEEYEATQQELEKAKSQANTYQGLLKQAQQKSISRDDLQPIYDRLDSQARFMGKALDDFRNTEGEYGESARKRTYTEDAEEHIKKTQEASKPTQDPEAEKFFEFLKDEGLEWEDPFVQDNIKDTTTPQEAKKNIKAAVKQRDESKIRDDIKKGMDEEMRQMKEKILVDYGLTDVPVKGPSAPSKDLSSMTPDEKLQEGFKKYKKK